MKSKPRRILRDRTIIFFIIAGFFASLATYVSAYVYVAVIHLAEASVPKQTVAYVVCTAIYLFIPLVLRSVSFYCGIPYHERIILRLRHILSKKTLSLSPALFHSQTAGAYLSAITTDVSDFDENWFGATATLCESCFSCIWAVAVLSYSRQWTLELLLSAYLILSFVLMFRLQAKVRLFNHEISVQNAQVAEHLENICCGFDVLRAGGTVDKYADTYLNAQAQLEETTEKCNRLKNLRENILGRLNMLFTFLSLCTVAKGIAGGSVSIAFAAMLVSIISIVTQACQNIVQSVGARNASESVILSHLAKVSEKCNMPDAGGTEPFDRQAAICFQNVSFSYDNRIVLSHVSCVFENGKKYKITGASGSGKTTLLHLICGDCIPTEGTVRVGSTPMDCIASADIHQNMTVVSQYTFLLKGTLRDNLTLFNKEIRDTDILRTLDDVKLSNFVTALPGGLDTLIEPESSQFSGGERQRLSIARALLRGTGILLADEITASLPPDTGSKIEKLLLSLPITVIWVSHREYGNSWMYDGVYRVYDGTVWDVTREYRKE